ncbi:MarR family transcriptional regulator [Streptomyces sp. NPDC018000]|uniref:MarR family transcriptional regulator n=1 Tax=Streptomyces sp. NPDC018000 TaxID=3365028 RepID=UPI00379F089B
MRTRILPRVSEAKPGYGKRSAPDQRPPHADDFALLPERERYVAGFVDHLPDGAAMNVKTLAKQLPLYGQQAVGSALTALSVAGHLRRVRCLVGEGEQVRWVFRTFWSRTARDNEWWNAYLDAEDHRAVADPEDGAVPGAGAVLGTGAVPGVRPALCAAAEPWARAVPEAPTTAPLSPRTRAQVPIPAPGAPADTPATPTPTPVPAVPAQPGPGCLSPAYLALARLGRVDHRLALSAADCEALEARATEWLARGVSTDYLTQALTAGLPARVDSPVGFLRHRLKDKIPPALPAAPDIPTGSARRVMVECAQCGTPGRPDALPDGLCRPCRQAAHGAALATDAVNGHAAGREVRAYVNELRDLLKAP